MESLSEKFNYSCTIALRWSDVDELGHINNAVYLTYLEEARINYFREVLNWDWKENGLILAKSVIDYKAPLYAENTLKIFIRCSRLGTKSFDIDYAMFNEKEQLIASASTIQVVFDYKTQLSVAIPDDIRKKIEVYEKSESTNN